MKKILLTLAVLMLLTLAAPAFADGGMIWRPRPDYDTHVYMPEQKAVIFWDGAEERMIVSTKVQTDDLLDMAWIIPVPSSVKPTVEQGDIQVFYDVAELFQEDTYRDSANIMGAAAESSAKGVELVEVQELGVYDVQMLKATNADSLINWLNAYGYEVPSSARTAIQHYIDMGNVYFIANKIDLENKYYGEYDPAIDDKCARALRYTNLDNGDSYIQSEMNEKDDCEGAHFDVVKAMLELKQGTATPLEITFKPDNAFYPMEMSSINEGDTNVNVYVFTKDPVKDTSGIMDVHRVKDITSWSKRSTYDLSTQNYATWMKYNGPLASLSGDSVFVTPDVLDSTGDSFAAFIEWTLGEGLLLVIAMVIIVLLIGGPALWYFMFKKE